LKKRQATIAHQPCCFSPMGACAERCCTGKGVWTSDEQTGRLEPVRVAGSPDDLPLPAFLCESAPTQFHRGRRTLGDSRFGTVLVLPGREPYRPGGLRALSALQTFEAGDRAHRAALH